MKYVVLLFLFVFPLYAQSSAFSVRENTLVWENVFITDEANVTALLEKHPWLKIISHSGNVYKGVAKGIKNSCPGTSSALVDVEMDFNFEIEKSNGMYRVTISKLTFLPAGKNKKSVTAESLFTEKNAVKPGLQTVTDLSCLDALFNRTFTATAILKNKP